MSQYSKHVERWSNCDRCDLCGQRRRMVFARGKVPAEVLFIGEAPGASEDVLGRPFAGPAGKLLDQIIERGLDGQVDYCITNLVCCYPKDAKATKNHEPPVEAIKACATRLEEMVGLVHPSLIVAVGRLSAKWLPILLKWTDRKPIVEIIHPAAILRMDVSQKALAIRRSIVTLEEAVAEL